MMMRVVKKSRLQVSTVAVRKRTAPLMMTIWTSLLRKIARSRELR